MCSILISKKSKKVLTLKPNTSSSALIPSITTTSELEVQSIDVSNELIAHILCLLASVLLILNLFQTLFYSYSYCFWM